MGPLPLLCGVPCSGGYTADCIAASKLRHGSSRPRITAATATEDPGASSSWLLRAAPGVGSAHRLGQLTLYCNTSCDLTESLPHAAPAETVPSMVDVFLSLNVLLPVGVVPPRPAHLRLNFPAETCTSLGRVDIDTSRTRAGITIDDKMLIGISSSCPNLRYLKA